MAWPDINREKTCVSILQRGGDSLDFVGYTSATTGTALEGGFGI